MIRSVLSVVALTSKLTTCSHLNVEGKEHPNGCRLEIELINEGHVSRYQPWQYDLSKIKEANEGSNEWSLMQSEAVKQPEDVVVVECKKDSIVVARASRVDMGRR
jgi:hypothetical protein